MNKLLSKRGFIGTVVLLAVILLAIYVENQTQPAPVQGSLTDITSIETLRTQFNKDQGFPRLILLASPT
jgi:hypothetical protein